MKSFLQDIANKYAAQQKLEELTFIFPNRRAALYFQYYLSQSLVKPQWAPAIYSIEEFFRNNSTLKEPDRLTLIHRLYHIYGEVLGLTEPFDRFFFWGDMLLRDFDEIDKYMINGPQLFKDLSKIKELDETFDFLTEEQKAFLQNFWLSFEEKPSATREQFLRLWRKLPKVYTEYTKGLRKEGLGYEGMIHRDVAEKIQKKGLNANAGRMVFAGFNALTKAEAMLITKAVEEGAKVHWDEDSYYTMNPIQEAGQFMRHYRQHPILKKTFEEPPLNFTGHQRKVDLIGVPQKIGQAKLAGEKVKEILATIPQQNRAMELARTVIVLPDESMLLPVLHSLPAELEDINVTMGFPLRETPLFSLLDLAVEMQCKKRKNGFSHREVSALLGHPYIDALAGKEAEEKYDAIISRNRVYVPQDELKGNAAIFEILFRNTEAKNATGYLLEVVEYLGASFSDRQSFDREFAFHFYQHISRLHTILSESTTAPEWRGFQKLFRQVLSSQKIPFSGEPLRGLQIMGVLETRNLDFDNVIILSLNEGMLPVANRQGTYIPNAIRKAYSLPTNEYNDAIYAYLFYRLLQRSETIQFFYNTEPDLIGNGEMSRYLQQVLLESKLPVNKYILHTPVHVQEAQGIVIQKTADVLNQLEKYIVQADGDAPSRLSPSTLNDYIECSLRFYLKNVVRLTEADEVEEDLDARVFGNILHDTIHWFYDEIRQRKNGKVEVADIDEVSAGIDALIDRAFREMYHMDIGQEVIYEGQRVIVREIARAFLQKILEVDRAYAPFEILMLEEPFSHFITLPNQKKVKVGGNIDRADRKDGVVRVIDYKTGRDELHFESIESLFSRDQKHNKAAFQTFLYAFVYQLRNVQSTDAIQPGLFNRKNLFEGRFEFGHTMGKSRTPILDARPFLLGYGTYLHLMVEEIFNPAVPFTQTTDEKKCQYCAYKAMCRR